MNVRVAAFLIFLTAFLLAILSVASIPHDVWASMPTYEGAIIAFNLLTGLAAVMVAYWIHADYERLQQGQEQRDSVDSTVGRLGKIVDDNFDIVFKRLEQVEETRRKEAKHENRN